MSGALRTEWTAAADGGPILVGRSWVSAAAPADVLLVHGLAEHSGRYEATAATLAAAGLAVHAVDYRGHGLSEGIRVHVDSVDDYVADVRAALAHVRRPGRPSFLLGHSQGGLVALLLALRSPEEVDGIVVTSPFLATHPEARPSRLVRTAAAVLLRVAPRLTLPTHIDVSVLARDPAIGEAYARDPLVSHRASAGWLRAVTFAQREVRAGAGRLRVPALVMASGGDRLVDPETTRRFVSEAPAGLVEFVWWEHSFHEMLNDLDRQAVLARIVTWLGPRSSAPALQRPGRARADGA
ncbi:MAG TPA: lysophospholipase [Vicinamibacteria bacterium]|nr:lysophospholipase [Vicinamibacteria bacterium]